MKQIHKIWTSILVVVLAIAAQAQTPVEQHGKLQLKGKQLCNEKGEAVQLRGISSHGIGWHPDCITEESLTHLAKDWKIDIFRLALYTQTYAKRPKKMLKRIDELVDLTEKLGLYCIIDWHVLKNGNPNTDLDNAVSFWKHIMKKHAKKKHVLFEICNEPNGKTVKWNDVKNFAENIIPIIRKKDRKTIIFVGVPHWSSDLKSAADDPLKYENLMYSFHFYAKSHKNRKKFTDAIAKIPVFVNEWGTTDANGSDGWDFESARKWLDIFDGNNPENLKISWINWSFADKKEDSAILKPGACKSKEWGHLTPSGKWIRKQFTDQESN